MYVIPFVRDTQNYVNATMLININEKDTSFSYLCDWQYQDTATTQMSAKNLALFMIHTDYFVFGSRMYELTDTSIFGRNDQNKKIMYLQLREYSQLGNSYYAIFQQCYTIYEPKNNGHLNGCPPGPNCPQYTAQTKCDNYYVWVNDRGRGRNRQLPTSGYGLGADRR